MSALDIQKGYVPGVVARLTELHTTYYGELWELGPQFEVEMAEGIAEFIGRYDPDNDGLWTVVDEDRTVRGGIIIDSRKTGQEGAQLRYFILDPALHGNGLGRRLLKRAIEFCRENGYERIFLWTVDELEAAVYLYREFGFEPTDTIDMHTGWETESRTAFLSTSSTIRDGNHQVLESQTIGLLGLRNANADRHSPSYAACTASRSSSVVAHVCARLTRSIDSR